MKPVNIFNGIAVYTELQFKQIYSVYYSELFKTNFLVLLNHSEYGYLSC